ncbi:MAG: hypothetical protein NVV60_05780 [Luteimonas sp.]|nr:hypothetical protein [Luteimonas sp.]
MATSQITRTTQQKARTAQALARALVPHWFRDVRDPQQRRALREAIKRQVESSLGDRNLSALEALAKGATAG